MLTVLDEARSSAPTKPNPKAAADKQPKASAARQTKVAADKQTKASTGEQPKAAAGKHPYKTVVSPWLRRWQASTVLGTGASG